MQHGRCGHLAPGDPQPACLPWPHLAAHCHHPCLTQVALVVFAVHTLVAEENAMDAEKAFVTLTVLNILNKAQAFLPFSIHSIVQVRPRGGEAVREEPCRLGWSKETKLGKRWPFTGNSGKKPASILKIGSITFLANPSVRIHSGPFFTLIQMDFISFLFFYCLYSHCASLHVMKMRKLLQLRHSCLFFHPGRQAWGWEWRHPQMDRVCNCS